MKTITTFAVVLSLTLACTSQNQSKQNQKDDEYKFPVFIDKREIKKDSFNMTWINHGNHNPLYFGEFVDTIDVYASFGWMYAPPSPPGSRDTMPIIENDYSNYFLDWMDSRDFSDYDSVELKILIDTSQHIANNRRKAYPVIIENLTSDTIYIGKGINIPIITEALNENGKWMPIEKRYMYMCGVGLKSIILPPKQIVVTSQLVYTGDFNTKLRMKLGSNYSREFNGSINLTQFKNEGE